MSYYRQPVLEPSYNVFDLTDLVAGHCTQNTNFPVSLDNEVPMW